MNFLFSQGDFGWAVVRLIFLENRRNIAASSCANLVSCGDRGWVRFWNTAQCTLAAEYVAHENGEGCHVVNLCVPSFLVFKFLQVVTSAQFVTS